MRSSRRTSPWFLSGLPKPHPSLSWHTLRYAPGQVAAPEGLSCSPAESAQGPSWPSSGTTGPWPAPRFTQNLPPASSSFSFCPTKTLCCQFPKAPTPSFPTCPHSPRPVGSLVPHFLFFLQDPRDSVMFLYPHAP